MAGENVTVGMLPQLEYLPLIMPEVVLALASVPLLDRDVVAGAAAAVTAVIDSGLYSPDAVIFTFEHTRGMPVHHPGSLVETPTGPAMFLQMPGGSYEMAVYSPGGGVPDHVDGAPTTVLLQAQGIPAEKVTTAFQTLLSTGAPEWRPDKAARLAEGLGWLRGAVALLLGGPRNFTTWQSDFLPKDVRVLLGLTPKEAHMARAFLRDQDPLHLMKILAARARDPERVVAEGPDVDAIIEDFGLGEDAIRFPEEIVLAAGQEFPYAGVKKVGGAAFLRKAREVPDLDVALAHHQAAPRRSSACLAGRTPRRLRVLPLSRDPGGSARTRRRLVAGSAGHRTRDCGGGGGQTRNPGGSDPLLAPTPGSPQPHRHEHRPLEWMAEGRTRKGRRSFAGEGPDRAGQTCARGMFPPRSMRWAGQCGPNVRARDVRWRAART